MNSSNYLKYIPVHSSNIKYESHDGKVTIFMENRGFYNRLAQKLFNKPKVSRIDLDETGCFIWPLIDGKRDILTISGMIRERFGEKAEPLFDRAARYFKTLEACGFIEFVNKGHNRR